MKPLVRRLEPEWLDHLPGSDPRAVRARRDLRFVNRVMGHAGIIARALRGLALGEAPRIAELGAGDGTLLLRIASVMKWPAGTDVVLMDRQPVVSAQTQEGYRRLGCRLEVDAADAFEWLAQERPHFDAIIANLFLHHFDDEELARLLSAGANRANAFIACEPRRARLPLAGSRMLGLIGCNDVTRHDAALSVRAGFAGRELSARWPKTGGWTLAERSAGLFSHVFTAHR